MSTITQFVQNSLLDEDWSKDFVILCSILRLKYRKEKNADDVDIGLEMLCWLIQLSAKKGDK